jgi:hypothetical protein
MSFVDSMVEQKVQEIATIVQYASNIWNTLDQEMIQEVVSFEQQLDRILGISPNTQAQPSNTTVTQPDSGIAKSYASGSGSGSGTRSTHEINSPQGRTAVQSLTSGSGSGSPAFSSGSATVSGYVWLDNNGDGYWDNNEKGYVLTFGLTTTAHGSRTEEASQPPAAASTRSVPSRCLTPVKTSSKSRSASPVYFEATKEGGTSQINAQGYSQPFDLAAGGQVQITGGLCSMNVNAFLV